MEMGARTAAAKLCPRDATPGTVGRWVWIPRCTSLRPSSTHVSGYDAASVAHTGHDKGTRSGPGVQNVT